MNIPENGAKQIIFLFIKNYFNNFFYFIENKNSSKIKKYMYYLCSYYTYIKLYYMAYI